jgi:cob(I)alamin adenosyltransferase
MGYRLSKIYTQTGDKGTTGLGDGNRVSKDCPRIEAVGAVDELNSAIGVVLVHRLSDQVRRPLTRIQHELFDLGGELAVPGQRAITDDRVKHLEATLDALNGGLPMLREFILPGGNPAAADCHLARAVCRRAERRLVTLSRDEATNPCALSYLNRLSDLLFVLARVILREAGIHEVLWEHTRTP